MPFSSFGLSEALLRAVTDQGHAAPTPIQSKAIPIIFSGRDVLAAAQTGTGKTAAFALPLLARFDAAGAASASPRALVVTPTRELAAQVADSVRGYGRHLSVTTEAIYGGVGMHPQIKALRRGVDILVATPGRLIDHLEQRTVKLSRVEVLVLDEADRMLDMGFLPAIRRILPALPSRRQNLLFSATFSQAVRTLAATLLNDPRIIEVAPRNALPDLIVQHVHPVDRERKREVLVHLITSGNWPQTLVFTRTKYGADRLAGQLQRDGVNADAIHGNKSQGARTKALAQFKQGRIRVLVATDIASRGIDVEQLSHVVNYELPAVPEDYIHRIGRTGRAGSRGQAVSLVCSDERQQLGDIQRLLGRTIPASVVAGFEPAATPQPRPAAVAVAPAHRRHSQARQESHHYRRGAGANSSDRNRGRKAT
jgi:ATP-dependent RNA helicase RhlE